MVSEGVIHVCMALRQEHHDAGMWWSQSAHFMVAKTQNKGTAPEREGSGTCFSTQGHASVNNHPDTPSGRFY